MLPLFLPYCQMISHCASPSPLATIVSSNNPDDPCEICVARGWGDPHIETFDGVKYDVHVKGELTFLKSLDNDFEIQGRTEVVGSNPNGPAVTTAVVVHENSIHNLPIIQLSIARPSEIQNSVEIGRCPVQLFVDKEYKNILDGTGTLDATVQVSGHNVYVEYPLTRLRLEVRVRLWKNVCLFDVNYLLADCRCNETLVGILGSPNGEWNDDWMDQDGTAVPIPEDREARLFEEAYNYSTTW